MRSLVYTSMLSLALFCPMQIFAAPVPPTLDETLQQSSPGQVIQLGFSSTSGIPALNANPKRLEAITGVLLYSDDPETVKGEGILYRDTLPAGPQRIYIYHVNDKTTQTRFPIVVQNVGAADATITFTHRSLPTPSANYVAIGREGVRQYYQNTTLPPTLTIPPQGTALLDSALDNLRVSRNQLVAGIFEYESTQPLVVAPLMVDLATDTLAAYPTMPFAENDDSNRQGTFAKFTRRAPSGTPYVYTTSSGMAKLRIGDGPFQTDPPAAGTDAENANAAINLSGNYGITYDISVAVNNNAGKQLAVLLNPRGGGYGGYFRHTLNSATAVPQMVPSTGSTVPATTSAGIIALLDLTAGQNLVRLEFIPAGASSLPIEILLVPYGELPPVPEVWMILGS